MSKLSEFYDPKSRRYTQIKWTIIGYDNYCFAENNKCYNRITGQELPQHLKKYSRGYYLNGDFVTLKKLRPLLNLIK